MILWFKFLIACNGREVAALDLATLLLWSETLSHRCLFEEVETLLRSVFLCGVCSL